MKSQLISTYGLEVIFFPPKCKISNRDLASCHVAFLLYLDIESVWDGGGGRDIESWVGSNHFSITLLYDQKKKKCLKNESLALLTQLHHLPFTSQPTAIWLPSRGPIQTALMQMSLAASYLPNPVTHF